MIRTSNSILEKVRLPIGKGEPFSFEVKRDDLIHSVISGNKWRKLKYNILQVEHRKNQGVLTFGGPYSNHLIATAKATNIAGLKSIGIVRGDELNNESNATLRHCAELGMQLVFISRSEYRSKDEPAYLKNLHSQYPNFFIVPEGGRNYYGVIGCQEILTETNNDYDHVYLAGGTGTTGAGLLLGSKPNSKIHVVSALKGDFLRNEIKQLLYLVLNDSEMVELYMDRLLVHNDSHFGGYAKVPLELTDYINSVYHRSALKLDPIYTSKAFYKMEEDYNSGLILNGEKVIFIHTGGLQGAEPWSSKIDFL